MDHNYESTDVLGNKDRSHTHTLPSLRSLRTYNQLKDLEHLRVCVCAGTENPLPPCLWWGGDISGGNEP